MNIGASKCKLTFFLSLDLWDAIENAEVVEDSSEDDEEDPKLQKQYKKKDAMAFAKYSTRNCKLKVSPYLCVKKSQKCMKNFKSRVLRL